MRVLFAGLGNMGGPMAKNLLSQGVSVTVYNRSAPATDWFSTHGATVASSPSEGAQEADVIMTMLSDDRAVEQVLLDPHTGCIQSARPGTLVIDSSTVSPQLSRRLSQSFATKGVAVLDAPVTGSAPQAIDGTLTFIVGGAKEDFERARPLFNAMGRQAFYVGAAGTGSTVKLANNTMVALNLMAVVEGLSIVETAGIDAELFLDIIAGGGAQNGMAMSKRKKLLANRFDADFAMHLMLKDLRLAGDVAGQWEIPLPGLALATTLYQVGCRTGEAQQDLSALRTTYRKLAGQQSLLTSLNGQGMADQ